MLEIEKLVIVLREGLAAGVAANAAGILGASVGRQHPELIGSDTETGDGTRHGGIVMIPVPVLAAPSRVLREIALNTESQGCIVAASFTDLARICRTYQEYKTKMRKTPESALAYIGLALAGSRDAVDSLTGSLHVFT